MPGLQGPTVFDVLDPGKHHSGNISVRASTFNVTCGAVPGTFKIQTLDSPLGGDVVFEALLPSGQLMELLPIFNFTG